MTEVLIDHLRDDHGLDGWDVALRLSNGYSLSEIHEAEVDSHKV